MGSTGSGRFTDYPGSGKAKSGGDDGGSSGAEDRCGKAFSAQLEDVEHSPYYAKHGAPPAVGTVLQVAIAKRVVAAAGGDIVGNLPTKFNYLAACIKDGYSYTGRVTTSKAGPSVIVSADFAADAA